MNHWDLRKRDNFKKLAIIIFSLLQKNIEFDRSIIEKVKEEKTDDHSKIRCPHCTWQPKKESRWFCSDCGMPEFFYDGCGTEWNTFDTGGKCPGCQHQWVWTSCLSCSQWSLHKDWYAKK
jgi:hypothetical protein